MTLASYEMRRHVGRWLSIKARQPADTVDFRALHSKAYHLIKAIADGAAAGPVDDDAIRTASEKILRDTLVQLSCDADHSDLLFRLLSGGEIR